MVLIIIGAVLFLAAAVAGFFNVSSGVSGMTRGMRDQDFHRGFDRGLDTFERTFKRQAILASLMIIGGALVIVGAITLLVG